MQPTFSDSPSLSHFLPSKARTEMHVKPRDAMHTLKSCQEEGQLKEGRAKSLKSCENSDDGRHQRQRQRQTALHPGRLSLNPSLGQSSDHWRGAPKAVHRLRAQALSIDFTLFNRSYIHILSDIIQTSTDYTRGLLIPACWLLSMLVNGYPCRMCL